MSNKASISMHESVLRLITDRWTRWRRQRELQDFSRLYPDEAGRIAHDLQMTTVGLIEVANRGSGGLDLLESRAKHCGIDFDELGQAQPDVARDLARCCALCRSKARCSRDLCLHPQNTVWRSYCCNSETFTALSAS